MRHSSGLSRKDSLVIKGVALLAMMWHHCFLSGRFDGFMISFLPLTQGQVENIAAFSKICVSLFAFVSGYGLCASLQNLFQEEEFSSKKVSKWVLTRYIKSFSGYWLIVVLAWIVTALIDMRPGKIYFTGSAYMGVFHMVTDLLGIGQLLGTPMLVGTWWYMSAAFVFIITAPLLYWMLRHFGGIVCLATLMIIPRIGGAAYPGTIDFYTFLPVFCIGMIFYRNDIFGRVSSWICRGKVHYTAAVLISVFATAVCYKLSYHMGNGQFWDFKYDLFVAVYVVLIYLTAAKIAGLKQVLAFLGKHSANIFMIHTFVRDVYMRQFIYSRGHFLAIIVTLLLISLLLSFALEVIKKLIHYEKFVNGLTGLASRQKAIGRKTNLG